MPVTSGMAAFGTKVQLGNGQSPESFTTIAELTTIDWSGMKVSLADMTNHGSVDSFKESVGTTIDPGQIKFTVNFIVTNLTHGYTAGLMLALVSKALRNFRWVFPDVGATTWGFSGIVSGFDCKAPVDGKMEANFTVDVSGKPSFV